MNYKNNYIKKCIYCGKEFSTQKSWQKFCCAKCREDNRKKNNKKQYIKVCKNCGEEFTTNLDFKKYCSKECRLKARKLRNNAKPKLKKNKSQAYCVFCGKLFYKNRANQKCCSQECCSEYKKIYRKKYNQEHALELKEYRERNKNKAKEYSKKYRKDNQAYLRKKRKEYEKTHKEQIKKYRKLNKHKFPSNSSEYYKKYYQENKERVKEISVKSKRKQRQNLGVKIRDAISSQITFAIKKHKQNKTFKSFELLDYTPEDLIKHLESLFQEGMNWDNYGYYGWHIDHIKPVASFNLINEDGSQNLEEIKKCWALENLQPLWG